MHGGDPGVVEIAQDKIDETVRASEGHGGFTAYLRQGHQSFTLAAGQNQGQDTRLLLTRMSSHIVPRQIRMSAQEPTCSFASTLQKAPNLDYWTHP